MTLTNHTQVKCSASLQSYSTVDEFDEPKVVKQNKNATATPDSFDQLLVEPSGDVVYPDKDSVIVSTRSGRWGTIADFHSKGVEDPVAVKFLSGDDSCLRRAESFKLRSYHSFVASRIILCN